MSTNDRGNSNELIYLLHRNDNRLNLLLRRDEEYATYIQSESYVPTTTNQVSTVVTEESVWNPGCEEATAAAAYATYTPRVRDTLPHLFYCDGDLCGLIMKRLKQGILQEMEALHLCSQTPVLVALCFCGRLETKPRCILAKTVASWNCT